MTTGITTTEPTELAVGAELPADQHPAAVYIVRLGKRSQRVMRLALDVIADVASGGRLNAEALPWGALRYQHTAAIRAKLIERYNSPATVNRHLSALRSVLKEAWKLGHMSAEDYHRAVELGPVKGEALPAGREVTIGELEALFQKCADRSPAGARDAALIAVLYGGGLRRSEAIALDLADYNAETGELRIRHGKGNKARLVYATNGGREAINAWIAVRGDEPGALLRPIHRSGRVWARRLTDNAITKILEKRAEEAKVAKFTPHDLRRSFISHLLGSGADISTVQQLAGHANVTTTQRYDRRGEEVKRRAVERLHVPYRRP